MEAGKNINSLHEGYLLHWYEIRRIIGRGGFGITYLAHDNNLDRYVAIKEFMPEDFSIRGSDSTVHPKTGDQRNLYEWGLERFIKEARTLAKFNHPNIVHVQSVFEQNNTAYMVMEYAEGEDLSTVYQKRSIFSEEQFLDTFIPVLDGLVLVHNSGFIHRDIKPANIYICDDDSPLLLDFGSARQSIGGKTKALTSLVTFGYAPYEQYNEGSGKQGPWTDIYSLGACIYVGITGQKPVDALQRGGNFLELGVDVYKPLSIIAKGDYSENFLLAVDNALMFKISNRPQNIVEWADMLMGKTQAPKLPGDMFMLPEADDETIVQPLKTTKPKGGDQAPNYLNEQMLPQDPVAIFLMPYLTNLAKVYQILKNRGYRLQ
jgi:serine/threonine protein kinase